MSTLTITSNGYSDIDNIYAIHNGNTTEIDTIKDSIHNTILYRKLPSVLSSTSSAHTWDDIQYTNNGDINSPTFVHLAINGIRPNTALDKFLMFTDDDVIEINTSSCEIFSRCELYAYNDNSGDNLLIFTYKSTESSNCAYARNDTRKHNIEDYASGDYKPNTLAESHIYNYNVNEDTITDIIENVMPVGVNTYYSVCDSCCSNESGITLITGSVENFRGTYYKNYQIINIMYNAPDSGLHASLLYEYDGTDVIETTNSFYPTCFFRCAGGEPDFLPYMYLRLYSFDYSNNVLYFVPVNVTKYFIADMSNSYFGRMIVTATISDYSMLIERHDSTYDIYVPYSSTLINRELNTLHLVNTESAKDSAGGLQSAYSSLADCGTIYKSAVIDANPSFVLDNRPSSILDNNIESNYWYKDSNHAIALTACTSSQYISHDYGANRLIVKVDDDATKLCELRSSVANGREVYTLSTSIKYAIIPFSNYYILLYSNGTSVIIG